MKLLTGNVSTIINQLAAQMNTTLRTIYCNIETIQDAGFVVNKLYCNVYQMGKVSRGMTDFKKTDLFHGGGSIPGCEDDCTSIANYVDNSINAANIEAIECVDK